MKKHLLFLVVIMLPLVTSAHDIEVKNSDGVTIYYNYTNNGTELEVTYRGDKYDSYYNEYKDNVVIPGEVTYMNRARKVTNIISYAFCGCNPTSVTIPSSVTSIGEGAFKNCASLNSVTISEGVTNIGEAAFFGCTRLTSLSIPSSVTSMGSGVFEHCGSLTSVTISEGVTSIGNSAFDGCIGLTSVTIPSSVTIIGYGAFKDCTGLTSLTIPKGVTKIGDSAFSGCTGLTSMTIPEGVPSIGYNAFEGCTSLTSVTIPSSVTSIGQTAFQNCTGLTSVHITDLAAWCEIEFRHNPLEYAHHLYLNGKEIKDLVIPSSVTSIGKGAFINCINLTSVIIPSSVTSIGIGAFINCTGLTSVTIGSSVASIGRNAFDGVDIPTIISLIENPFTIYGKSSNYRTFTLNTFSNATLRIPKGFIDKYKATEGWRDFVFIEENGTPPTPPTPEKCEKPIISYSKGRLAFSSSTEGATCRYSITDSDIKSGSGSEVQLGVTYNISVYATKEGYENSETATATICWIDATPQTEGITNGMAQIAAHPVLVKADNGFITVEGVDDRTNVSIYTMDGKQVGSAISHNNAATIATNIRPGSIAIVKVGEKSVKVMVK